MSTFSDLEERFGVNWATVSIGWKGLGVFSLWPGRWKEFHPLLSAKELGDYALARLDKDSDREKIDTIISLLSLNLREESGEVICVLLDHLSNLEGSDPALEIRKWRVVLLEQLLQDIPTEPLYGLIAFTDFWNDFGFPSDSPHEVQGRWNSLGPQEYYTQENLDRTIQRHRKWIENEVEAIKKANGACSS